MKGYVQRWADYYGLSADTLIVLAEGYFGCRMPSTQGRPPTLALDGIEIHVGDVAGPRKVVNGVMAELSRLTAEGHQQRYGVRP